MNKLFLILICAFGLSGCAMLSNTAAVQFSISDDQEDFDSWEISVCRGDEMEVLSLEKEVKDFSLVLPKNIALGILAYPVKNGRKLLPLGTVYPFKCELTLKDGFAAYIADRLYRGATDSSVQVQEFVSRFNWQRFLDLCNEYENPWDLDSEKIIKSIAAGTFRKSDLKLLQN